MWGITSLDGSIPGYTATTVCFRDRTRTCQSKVSSPSRRQRHPSPPHSNHSSVLNFLLIGLRKYLSAASQLFDPRQSRAELLSIKSDESVVEVAWRLGGVIMLPWHPTVEPWTGKTRYHVGPDGLIYHHEESWDISVWRAFASALYPESRVWPIWEH